MVRHIGILTFKPDITGEQVQESLQALQSLVGRIPGLLDMEYGPYESSEGLNDGFTHGFIMTFDSPASREAYLPHPLHELVKDLVVPRLARVIVFDFTVS